MDIEFINKRIQEQKDHIEYLMATPMEALRKIELLESTRGQLTYFQEKKYNITRPYVAIKLVSDLWNINIPGNNPFHSIPVEVVPLNPYRDELKNILGPEQEFESLAAAITTPFSVAQAIHG